MTKMKEKVCPRCGISKKVNQFSKSKDKKDGLQYSCKECDFKRTHTIWEKNKKKYREITKISSRKIRAINADKISKLKENKVCILCGEKDIKCLDFHHIDPKKKHKGISRLLSGSYSWKMIEKEIKKCQVLCANCHRATDAATQIRGKLDPKDNNIIRNLQRIEINKIKEKLGCLQCGHKIGVALDFHHKDPSTKIDTVSRLVGFKWQTVQNEIDKCEILCANCHRKHHALEKEGD